MEKRKKKEKKSENKSYEKKSDEDEDESYEEYSSKEKEEENDVPRKKGGKGLKVEEGQKLNQKQLQMLETMAEEKLSPSTNPLCQAQKDLFRSLYGKAYKHEVILVLNL